MWKDISTGSEFLGYANGSQYQAGQSIEFVALLVVAIQLQFFWVVDINYLGCCRQFNASQLRQQHLAKK